MSRRMVWTALRVIFWISLSQAQSTCRYTYTEQPPQDLTCNPYPAELLRLNCEVSYGSREESVSLQWIHIPNSNTQTPRVLTGGTKYTITPATFTSRVTSRLQINNLDNSGTDAGGYSCQIVFRNGSRTETSQKLNLFTSSVFTGQNLPTCTQFSGESTRDVTTTSCAFEGEIGNGVSIGGTDSNNPNPIGPTTAVVTPGGGVPGIQNYAIYIAVGAVVIFLVVTALIITICCVCFQACKYFD